MVAHLGDRTQQCKALGRPRLTRRTGGGICLSTGTTVEMEGAATSPTAAVQIGAEHLRCRWPLLAAHRASARARQAIASTRSGRGIMYAIISCCRKRRSDRRCYKRRQLVLSSPHPATTTWTTVRRKTRRKSRKKHPSICLIMMRAMSTCLMVSSESSFQCTKVSFPIYFTPVVALQLASSAGQRGQAAPASIWFAIYGCRVSVSDSSASEPASS
jgi:hypothetical protein